VKGYLVDTNIPSELTRERPDARVAAILAAAGQNSVFLCILKIGEICTGIAGLPASQKRTGVRDWLDIEVRAWFAGRILPIRGLGRSCSR
jgi:predicted nucleic acid-binding protein